MENLPLLIARRRNQQRRLASAWLVQLEDRTGIRPTSIALLSADASIARERKRREMVQMGLADGWLQRVSGASKAQATAAWESFIAAVPQNAMVVCEMSHHADFPFSVHGPELSGKLESMLDFDTDTVALGTANLERSVVIDMYVEKDQTLYELDSWDRD